ncbi:DNA polymerase eta-like isoform X2 [Apostichopus japonicus]
MLTMSLDRVVVLIDMDCFYVQVEQRDKPELKGKPCAVVQYKTYKGGGTIAVSYEARDRGVKRGMMGDEAQKFCPEIELVRVPVQRDKADLTKYREAGAEVINVLMQFSKKVERASIDEAFIDLTDEVEARLSQMGEHPISLEMLPYTHVAGWQDEKSAQDDEREEECEGKKRPPISKEDMRKDQLHQWLGSLSKIEDKRLAVGAVITEEMRAAVLQQTKFNCSAGIAHNKMLSKLVCGLNKPRKQSVLPHDFVNVLFRDLPIVKVRGLGGKLGASVAEGLNAVNMGDLLQYSEAELQAKVGPKSGAWLYNICRGFESEPVRPRQLPKSVGCSKNFLGRSCLDKVEKVRFWLSQLSEEVAERLQKEETLNNRVAKSMCIYVRQQGNSPSSVSRSCALHAYDTNTLSRTAMSLIQGLNRAGSHQAAWSPPIINLGLSTTKFTDVPQYRGDNTSLDNYFSIQGDEKLKAEPSSAAGVKPTKSQHQLENFFTRKESEGKKREGEQNMTSNQSSSKQDHIDDVTPNGKLAQYFTKSPNVNKKCINDEDRTYGTSEHGKLEPRNHHGDEYVKDEGLCEEKVWNGDNGCDNYGDELGQDTVVDEPTYMADEPTGSSKSFFKTKEAAFQNSSELNLVSNSKNKVEKELEEAEISDNSCLSFQNAQSKDLGGDVENPPQSDETDYVTCDQCQDQISAWELPEHLDFHVAMAIQEQENGVGISSSSSSLLAAERRGKHDNTRAGKRKGTQRGACPSSKKSKSDPSNQTKLHSFFSQK